MIKKTFIAPLVVVALLSLSSFTEGGEGEMDSDACNCTNNPGGMSVKIHCFGKYGFSGCICLRGKNGRAHDSYIECDGDRLYCKAKAG